MYRFETTVRLHHTDAAGLLFFAAQFHLAHDAYESWMESIGYAFAPLLRTSPLVLPIVHAEADYKAPLSTGDRLTIEMTAEHIGEHSFVLAHRLLRGTQEVGTAKTVHVLVDKRNGEKQPLPDKLKGELVKIKT